MRKNQRWRYRIGLLLLSLLTFLSVTWVVLDDLFAPFEREGRTVTVPSFVGLDAAEIEGEDWIELEIEYRYDDSARAGIVTAQSPAEGSVRKISDRYPVCRVSLTVSLGSETVLLPDVVGLDVRDAEARLRRMGLAVEQRISAGAYPEGEVFGMSPHAGERVPVGARITLYASAGTPAVTVEVPDLYGLSRGEALTKLWLSQLSVAEVVEVESEEASGIVVGQNYPPRTVVMAGTKLTLYVSREDGFE